MEPGNTPKTLTGTALRAAMSLSMAVMNLRTLLRIFGFVLFLTTGGVAQRLPEAPHKFWDRKNKTLFLIHAGVETTDFAITHHNLANGGREMNPLGRSVCESGTAGQAAFFGMRTAGRWASAIYFTERITIAWNGRRRCS